MKMEFEYGKGTVEAKLPDNTDIFIPGETVKDPEYIPEEQLEKHIWKAWRILLGCRVYRNWRIKKVKLHLLCRIE